MNQTANVDSNAFQKRLDLGAMKLYDALHYAADQYRRDPLFCIPQALRRPLDRAKGVLLGTSWPFAEVLINHAKGRLDLIAVVDDFKAGKQADFHGIPLITSAEFISMGRRMPDLVALNSCRFDYSRRFFMDLARHGNVACLSHEQMIRLYGWQPAQDHRVDDWGPLIAERLPELLALGERFSDEYSRETLYGVLLFHLTCDPEWYLNIARPYSSLYFRSGLFYLSDREKLVDCGASIGESTTALIGISQGNFSRSWMIEPDRVNVETLAKMVARYEGTPVHPKLTLLPVAVGETSMQASFTHGGGHAGTVDLSSGGTDIQIERIDDIVDDAPTMIKMDLEGFEMPALRGARQTILASRAKLAISTYHRPSDLLDIAGFVEGLGLGYKVGLRHHTEDRWDTCLYFYH